MTARAPRPLLFAVASLVLALGVVATVVLSVGHTTARPAPAAAHLGAHTASSPARHHDGPRDHDWL